MALANTRPVQLPVHSPHTEFSDIGLNHHSKIKLSPSQVSKGKTKTLAAKPMTESKGKHDESGYSNSGNFMGKTENEVLSMQFNSGIDDDIGSTNSPTTSSFGENSRSPSTNPSIISNQDSKDIKNGKQDDSSIDSSGFATAPTTPAASGTASASNPNSNSTVEKPRKKYNTNPDKQKANKANKINIAATGISTTIPVTGERPRPDKHASLEDEVLLTIFKILYDYDAAGKGMTVKQICDVLLEKHPETAKLSSKTSNLVSAKLNAYVKRVEKGEKNLTYALSREWADTSPKRMVYVYRGLLTDDYFVHAIAAMKNLEENFEDKTQVVGAAGLENSSGSALENTGGATANGSNVMKRKSSTSVSDLASAKNSGSISNSKLLKKSSSTNFNGGNSNNNNNKSGGDNSGSVNVSTNTSNPNTGITNANLFNNNSESHIDLRITPLTIPYNADVLSAQLDTSISNNSSVTTVNSAADSERVYESPAVSDYDLDEFDSFDDRDEDEDDDDDDDDDDDVYDGTNRSKSSSKLISFTSSVNGISGISRKDKRSNSGSLKYPGKLIKRVKNITAAAAAPRVPKNMSNSPSPSIVMAAAASLRAAALHALSPSESSAPIASTNDSGSGGANGNNGLDNNDRASGNNNNGGKNEGYHQSVSARWLQTVREGFLTQDIGTPEDISLAELDSLFR